MSRSFETYLAKEGEGDFREIDRELGRFLLREHPGEPDALYYTACLLSWAYRQGDVCLDLRERAGGSFLPGEEGSDGNSVPAAPPLEEWMALLRESPAVGAPGDFRPLILDPTGRLYLHRLHAQEQNLARHILRRCEPAGEVDEERLRGGLQRLFPPSDDSPDWQRVGAAMGVLNRLAVISGGPGTGKTATVIRLMALLLEQAEPAGDEMHFALAAPTGKAAARLKESVLQARGDLDCSEWVRKRIPGEAVTLHSLLGARRHSTEFRYNSRNPLPADVVIVDEASMVDQALMNRLLEALAPGARLVLLGDKDQLASVEAGSVLGDLCGDGPPQFSGEAAGTLERLGLALPAENRAEETLPLNDHIVLLTRNYRFGRESGIAALSGLVNLGEAGEALRLLESGRHGDLEWREYEDSADYRKELSRWAGEYLRAVNEAGEPGALFRAIRSLRLLSPHRRGPLGTEDLNRTIEHLMALEGLISRYRTFYAGKPIMIRRNDPSMNLHNGDLGICFPEGGEMRIWFEKEGDYRSVSPARLPPWETAFAITVHKSQGSEYREVLLLLPGKASPVLSRELLYTAVTRAREGFRIRGSADLLAAAVENSIERSSGLKDRLW